MVGKMKGIVKSLNDKSIESFWENVSPQEVQFIATHPEQLENYEKSLIKQDINKILIKITTGKFDITQAINLFKKFEKSKDSIIEELYLHLIQYNFQTAARSHLPAMETEKLLGQYESVFNQLIAYGARFDHLFFGEKKQIVLDLVEYALDTESLTMGLTSAILRNPNYAFEPLKELADVLIDSGANVNGTMEDPQDGHLLHRYLLSGKSDFIKILRYLDSKRTEKVNTQCCTLLCNSAGFTPLLLAIYAVQEDAALELLEMDDAPVNTANHKGQTPLMIAAALGMLAVVEKLVSKKAKLYAHDVDGNGLADYAIFNETELMSLYFSSVINPLLRSNMSKQDYLLDLQGVPLCFYKPEEHEQFGHQQQNYRVRLSPCKLYYDILLSAVDCIEGMVIDEDRSIVSLLLHVRKQLEEVRGKKSVLEVCLENQLVVQEYLRILSKSKEKVTLHFKTKSGDYPATMESKESEFRSKSGLLEIDGDYYADVDDTLQQVTHHLNDPTPDENSETKVENFETNKPDKSPVSCSATSSPRFFLTPEETSTATSSNSERILLSESASEEKTPQVEHLAQSAEVIVISPRNSAPAVEHSSQTEEISESPSVSPF